MVKFYGDFFISPVPEIVSCDKIWKLRLEFNN